MPIKGWTITLYCCLGYLYLTIFNGFYFFSVLYFLMINVCNYLGFIFAVSSFFLQSFQGFLLAPLLLVLFGFPSPLSLYLLLKRLISCSQELCSGNLPNYLSHLFY